MTDQTPKSPFPSREEAVLATWSAPGARSQGLEEQAYLALAESRGCKRPEEEVLVRPDPLVRGA